MNQLKTTDLGGFPFVLDDLRWTADGIKEAIAGHLLPIIEFLGDSNSMIILNGCVATVTVDDFRHVSEGFIFWNNEVFHVPAQSVFSPDSENANLILETQFDVAGDKVTFLGGTINAYEVRTLKLVNDVTPITQNLFFVHTNNRYNDILKRIIASKSETWRLFTDYKNDNIYGVGLTPVGQYRKYMKDIDGFVHLAGEKVYDDGISGEETICTLPVGNRPPSELTYPITLMTVTEPVFAIIKIKTNGEITISSVVESFQSSVYFNSIPPFRVV